MSDFDDYELYQSLLAMNRTHFTESLLAMNNTNLTEYDDDGNPDLDCPHYTAYQEKIMEFFTFWIEGVLNCVIAGQRNCA